MSNTKNIITNINEGILDRIKNFLKNPYKRANLSWLTIKLLKHRPNGKLRSHKLLGKKTFYRNNYEYLHALEEIFIQEIYLQKLPKNAFIIDCGSHIGISVIYLKFICNDATIIAYEPDKNNFDLLQLNVNSHNLKGVELKNEAVWKENKSLNFLSNSNMGSKLVLNETGTTSKLVKAIRLKNLLIKKIDFLKIDIEGAEYEVLLDIQDNLHFVNNLFIEYHGSFNQNNQLLEMLEILNNKGFLFYIKEATSVFDNPFHIKNDKKILYDLQLNIFCFKKITDA